MFLLALEARDANMAGGGAGGGGGRVLTKRGTVCWVLEDVFCLFCWWCFFFFFGEYV